MREHRERWELRNPAAAIEMIADRVELRPGRVILASFVLRAGGASSFVGAALVHDGLAEVDEWAARERLADVAIGLAGPSQGPPTQTAVMLICRTGRVIDTENEWFWFFAWWYSNHLSAMLTGEQYVVTDHGWTGLGDDRAGRTPCLIIG